MLIGAIIFAVILFSYLIIRGRKRVKKDAINLVFRVYAITYFNKEAAMFKALNVIRAAKGLKLFKTDREVDARAENRLKEIIKEYIETGTISHEGFGDDSEILIQLGMELAGENIAFGYGTVTGAMNAFIKSPGHYKNIINPEYDIAGCAIGTYKGRMFFVQFYGGDDEI